MRHNFKHCMVAPQDFLFYMHVDEKGPTSVLVPTGIDTWVALPATAQT